MHIGRKKERNVNNSFGQWTNQDLSDQNTSFVEKWNHECPNLQDSPKLSPSPTQVMQSTTHKIDMTKIKSCVSPQNTNRNYLKPIFRQDDFKLKSNKEEKYRLIKDRVAVRAVYLQSTFKSKQLNLQRNNFLKEIKVQYEGVKPILHNLQRNKSPSPLKQNKYHKSLSNEIPVLSSPNQIKVGRDFYTLSDNNNENRIISQKSLDFETLSGIDGSPLSKYIHINRIFTAKKNSLSQAQGQQNIKIPLQNSIQVFKPISSPNTENYQFIRKNQFTLKDLSFANSQVVKEKKKIQIKKY